MRALVLLATVLTVPLLSGCVDVTASAGVASDCSHSIDQETSSLPEVVGPREAPTGRPQVEVEARAGQSLMGVAVWEAAAGEAEAVVEGPSSRLRVENGGSLQVASVGKGTYTLSLEGVPVAAGVRYVLTLFAVGCTPVAG